MNKVLSQFEMKQLEILEKLRHKTANAAGVRYLRVNRNKYRVALKKRFTDNAYATVCIRHWFIWYHIGTTFQAPISQEYSIILPQAANVIARYISEKIKVTS